MKSDNDNSNNNNNNSVDVALKAAQIALEKTRYEFPYGSANIKPIQKWKHPASDKILITPSLFENYDNKRKRMIEALVPEVRKKEIDKIVTDALDEHAFDNLDKLREIIKSLKNRIDTNPYLTIEEKTYLLSFKMRFYLASRASELGSGNCGEMAPYTFMQLIFNDYPGKLDYVKLIHKDRSVHEFLILNRKEGSDIKDWKTWGRDTIILDPWLNKIFRADEFEKVWKDNSLGVKLDDARIELLFDQAVYNDYLKREP